MAKTLYDLLEVSQTASADSITSNYKRLFEQQQEAAAAGDEDATNHLIALREAFNTLSNREKRIRYDQSLMQRASEPAAGSSHKTYIVAGLLALIIAGGMHYKQRQTEQELARIEFERAAAAARLAEQEANKAREERLAIAASNQAERLRIEQANLARHQRERDIAYGNQVSQSLARAEHEARMAKQRADYQNQQAERQRQSDAERQLEREKAYLRQREWENRR